MRSIYRHRLGALAAVLLLALAGPVFGQLETGDIYGKVIDTKGQALPGATVTLTGIGAPKVETTDRKGTFRYLGLYPGKYAVKAELEGFNGVEYPDVQVRIGGKAQIEMTLNPSLTESITVVAESPLLDARRTNRGATVSADDLNKVPTARDPWSLLSQAPGVQVDRINVGGNESGQQSDFIGVGAGGRDNTFAVDGVIMTDMNAVGGSLSYYDFGAFEEVQFTVSSADVTVATSGVTINQVTKRGTNEWKANGRFLRTDRAWQAPTFKPNGNKIKSVDEYGADAGGPLWKDHLWIWASDGRSDIQNLVPNADPTIPAQLDRTKLKDFNSKLNFQAGPANSGVLHYWTNDKLKFGRNAGPLYAHESTWNQTTPSDIYKAEDSQVFGQNIFLTGLFSHNSGKFTLTPPGGLQGHIFIDDAGTHHGSWLQFAQKATIDQGRADGNYQFNVGQTGNELKFGGSYRQQTNDSGTVWPNGQYVVSCVNANCPDLGFSDPLQVVFPRNRTVSVKSSYASAWLQDTLTAGRLTLSAGVRMDDQKLTNRPSSDGGNPQGQGLLPAINFQGNKAGGFDWRSYVPRVSATYALNEQRKTLLRGTFSQYAEQLGQNPLASRVNPVGYQYAYFYFNDANHNHIFDPSEAGSLVYGRVSNINVANPASLTTANINDPHLKPMLTNEVTAGIEQGIGNEVALGFTATWRRISRVPETRLLVTDASGATRFATRDDYVLATDANGQQVFATGTLPNGQVVSVPFYNLSPGVSPTGGTFYTNGDRTQRYLGGTLSATKRLSHNWTLRGHVTYADWKWKIGPQYIRFHDPTSLVQDDLLYATHTGDPYFEQSLGSGSKGDVLVGSGKWNYNVNGLYQVAPQRWWGFDIGGSITGRQGYTSPPYVFEGGPSFNRQVRLEPSINRFRNDNIFLLDGHLGKDFKFGDLGMSINVDGFNLTNKHYVLQRERNVILGAPRANFVNEYLSPRVFRVGAVLHWK
ncbi:MAG TPA: TonB-dependent receptor [Thermoanaerobaculia bacterium]|nr:TonB-dependent receptor [Thermoanaerobaculia bacterium]